MNSQAMKTVFLAITDFALPVPRQGHIESHSGYGPLPEVGSDLHRLIQSERMAEEKSYESEVRVQHTFTSKKNRYHVAGRIDGLFSKIPKIEEIKTTYNLTDLVDRLQKSEWHPYRLQAQTYAYLYWLKTGRVAETVIHVVSARTGEGVDVDVLFNPIQYEIWLQERLNELDLEVQLFDKTLRRRKLAHRALTFPFPEPREGQEALMKTIDDSIAEKKFLMLQAPTGLGKTVGVLLPMLRDSLSRGEKLIYVTPKNSQHEIAEDAVERLQSCGPKIKSLTIAAKSKMCFKAETICNPTYCEFARDYYAKVEQAKLKEKLLKKKRLTRKTFRRLGDEFEVCPFELQFEAIENTDVVICDYNYVFSPRNSVGRIAQTKLQRKKTKPNLIIDEAHNLPQRALDYFSPSISSVELGSWREEVLRLPTSFANTTERLLDRAIKLVDSIGSATDGPSKVIVEPGAFLDLDVELRLLLNRYLESDVEILPRDVVLRLCDRWSEFTAALQLEGPEFSTTSRPLARGYALRVNCCDASKALEEAYESFHRVVAFSATLKPFDYYLKLSGINSAETHCAEFGSPFPPSNRKLLVIPQISTKYSARERNYGKIRDCIERIVNLKPGNYFVFFPSFDFMERVFHLVELPQFQMLKQEREMKLPAIKEVLAVLHSRRYPTIVFAVQGGVFSEGVDYPGESLIGALIVGPALPSYDLEREILREYFEKKFGSGFDYAYTYPAMAKVIQSAGRVIRSPTDRGLIVLMDQRFVQSSYVETMPKDWISGEIDALVSKSLLSDINQFWSEPLVE